jgi:hypothetical protein
MTTLRGKKFTTLICTILSIFLIISPLNVVRAQSFDILTPLQVFLDTTISREDTNYNVPTQIVIVPIFPKANDEIKLDSKEMFRGIYFYTVDFLGFNDIPFHYVVSQDGEIFRGNSGGEERRIKLNGVGDDMVIIGYMTTKSAAKFDYRSEDALVYLLSDIANRRAINPENIQVYGAKFEKDQTLKTVTLEKTDLFGNWPSNLAILKDRVKASFNPVPKTYSLSVDDVILPEGGINPGEEGTVTVKLTNNSDNGMYAGTNSEIILTKTDGNSQFYLNNEWVSRSQVPLLGQGELLLPFQSGSFDFKVKAPLFPGVVTENFEFRTPEGNKINVSNISISLTINSSDKKIVEIRNTETGTLNVRTEPSSVAPVLSQVSPGQRYFLLEQDGSGFIKIDLGDGTSGWIAGWYTNPVN